MPTKTSSYLVLAGFAAVVIAACGGATTSGINDGNTYQLQKNPDGSATGNGSTCTYQGRTSSVGEVFMALDGCNDCQCTAQGVMCTVRACAGSSTSSSSSSSSSSGGGSTSSSSTSSGSTSSSGGTTGTCTYEGKQFKPGDVWTIPNPKCPAASIVCKCDSNGLTVCAADSIACTDPDPGQCPAGSCGPSPGTPTYQCADGTTSGPGPCEIQKDGKCGWSIHTCICKDPKGGVYKPGSTWSDGCNTCTCSNTGVIACTKKACACPPNQTINCMPPISPDKTDLCAGAYHDWLKDNCPGVLFVY